MPENNYFVNLSEEVLSIIETGSYKTSNGTNVDITGAVKVMLDNTRVLKGKTYKERPRNIEKPLRLKNVQVCIGTVNESIDYWSSMPDISKIVVLNFASAKHPGGGFLNGSTTQEEQLCYTSLLYRSLISKEEEFYKVGRKNSRGGLYLNSCIYTENVPFIRDAKYNLVEPKFLDVITCPAVNRSATVINGISEEVVTLEMYSRCKLIMNSIMQRIENNSVILLGAYGCGVFKNNPYDVANIFKIIINEYRGIIKEKNITIDFPIPKGVNFAMFSSNLY